MATHVDTYWYQAAQQGNSEVLRTNYDQPHMQLTPCKNTLLHVLAQFNDNYECVNAILQSQGSTIKQSLLTWKNSKGETALHIAASKGRFHIVKELLEYALSVDSVEIEGNYDLAQRMMRSIDQNGDTALHGAVRNKHARVVRLLVESDPDFCSPENKSKETPLYLAAEQGGNDMVVIILTNSTIQAYGGPGGKNALHAAVISNNEDCTKKLINHNPNLIKDVDEFGWSPLHYAARFNFVGRARQLLQADKSVAYIAAHNDDNKTPLHIAVCEGKVEVIVELMEHCLDCWEMTTHSGRNVLHLAVDHEQEKLLNFIVNTYAWAANLINEKDDEGNTPIHLYAASNFIDAKILLSEYLGTDTNVFNWKNLTPLEVIENLTYQVEFKNITADNLKSNSGKKGYRNIIQRDHYNYKKWKENIAKKELEVPNNDLIKIGDTHLIVAALIATITFAAGFTVPGGYDGNQGSNQGKIVFAKKTAFMVFLLTDTIALISSIIAIFLYFSATMYKDRENIQNRIEKGIVLVIISMTAMMIAFMTGLYTVLSPSSLGLAISICIFCSLSITIMLWLTYRSIVYDFEHQRKSK